MIFFANFADFLGELCGQELLQRTMGKRSSRSRSTLAIHPLPNKVRTRENTEIAVLSLKQIGKPSRIQFLQIQEIQLWPQSALGRRLDQLFQIRQMSLK